MESCIECINSKCIINIFFSPIFVWFVFSLMYGQLKIRRTNKCVNSFKRIFKVRDSCKKKFTLFYECDLHINSLYGTSKRLGKQEIIKFVLMRSVNNIPMPRRLFFAKSIPYVDTFTADGLLFSFLPQN